MAASAIAEIPEVNPPAFLTTDNSANWEPGTLLFREVGLGRTTVVTYHNGVLYAGGYAGSPYSGFEWSDFSDATSLSLTMAEGTFSGISTQQGTHGHAGKMGDWLLGGIKRTSTLGVNVTDGDFETDFPDSTWGTFLGSTTAEESPNQARPSPVSGTGASGTLWPWGIPFKWPQYGGTSGDAYIYRADELLGGNESWGGVWNIEEAGVLGPTLLVGNLLIVTSDETLTGVAVWDIGPMFNTPAEKPVLLDKLDGNIGGYLPAVWRDYIVLPNDGLLHMVNFSDPRNLVYEGAYEVPTQPGQDYIQFQDQYGFYHGNKIDMETGEVVLTLAAENPAGRPASSVSQEPLSVTQYLMPMGNLLATGGRDSSNDIWDGVGLWVHQAAPDTSRPEVSYHVPRPNATNFPVGAPVTLVINETLEGFTIVPGESVILKKASDGSIVDTWMSFSHDDLLTITPKSYLEIDTEYVVEVVDNGIQDVAGNGIVAYTFNFSTGNNVNGNQPPVITAVSVSSSPVAPGSSVNINVSANDPDGSETLEYRVNYGDGSPVTDWLANETAYNYTYTTEGHYELKVQVREQSNPSASSTDISTVTVVSAPTGTAPTNSSPLAIDAVNDRVWVVNPDNDSVTWFDRTSPSDGGNEIALSSIWSGTGSIDPRSVAVDASGRAWIACHDADRVLVVELQGANLDPILALDIDTTYGSAPTAVAASPGGSSIYFTTEAGGATDANNGQLIRFSASTLTQTGIVELGPMARPIAISGDESRVYVGRFISGPILGEIWEIDGSNPASLSFTETVVLPVSTDPSGSSQGPGIPNYISGITITPDGDWVWYAAKKDNILEGDALGKEVATDTTVRAMVGRFPVGADEEDTDDRIDFDNADSPTAVAFTGNGDWAFVTAQGNNLVGVFDVLAIDSGAGGSKVTQARWSESTGPQLAPQGAVFDALSGNLWVKNFMSRSVTVFDAASFLGVGGAVSSSSYSSVSSEALSGEVFNGKQIFYNASDGTLLDNRMSDEGYISCATCHVDGMHDGQTFDFTQRGEGLRNTTDLRGRAGLGHGNVHWTANFDEIHDFNLDIVNHFGGKGFPSGVTPNDPLGASNDSGDSDLSDLVAYVSSLDTATLPKSPYRAPDGEMTTQALDGIAVFTAMNCASCHNPDTEYTDSVVGDGTDALHPVGTLRDSSGSRLDGPLNGIDTPTLLGIWNTAPYFHNGTADTLDQVFYLAGGTEYQFEDGDTRVIDLIDKGPDPDVPGQDGIDDDGWPRLRIGNQWTGALGGLGGRAVQMRYLDNWAEITSIDGGAGGLAQIEIRYYTDTNVDVEISVNGAPEQTLTLNELLDGPNNFYGWSLLTFEAQLNAGPTNTIRVTMKENEFFLNLDAVTVSNVDDIAAAAAHRDLATASATDYDAVLAYLLQLDGRDADGNLPGEGGAGSAIVEIDPWGQYDGFVFRVENTGDDPITQIDLAVTGGGQFDTFAPGSQFTVDPVFGTNNQAPKSVTATLNFSPSLGAGQTDTAGAINNFDAGDIDGNFTGLDVTVHFAGGGSASGTMVDVGDSDDGDPSLWQFVASSGGGATVIATDDTGISVDEGSNVIIDVLGNDTPVGLSVQSVTQGSLGSVTNNGGDVTYTAASGVWSGTDTFTYTATDGSTNDIATVEVTINATDGLTPVPAASFNGVLEGSGVTGANRILTSNGNWQLSSNATGFDTSGSNDSLYMLADDTVSGDFQAYVQLVSLSGPSGSRMGLMLRDGDTTGAEFIAIGSDASDGYTFQERDGSGGANAEVDATVGSAHTFPGKWVLLERVGSTVTVAVDEDNTGAYTPETTVDISGWSDTLHMGLFVHSGAAGTNAVAEFDGYSVVPITPTPGAGTISEVAGSFTEGLTSATVPTGDNRLLVFVAQSESAGVLNSVTYGGQSLTKAVDKTQLYNEVSIWYLDDAGITAASGTTFVPSWSGNENGEGYSSFFLTGVDQAAPLGEIASAGDPYTSANVDISTAALAVSAGDYSVFGVVRGSSSAAFTFSGGYTEKLHYSISSGDAAVATQAISADGSVTPTVRHGNANYRIALAACVFKAAPAMEPELLLDASFDATDDPFENNAGGVDSTDADEGWKIGASRRWTRDAANDRAVADPNGGQGLMQVLTGTGITGSHIVQMDAENIEASGSANFLKLQIMGVNGTSWNASSWNEGIPSGGVELYDSGDLGGVALSGTVVDTTVDFGAGYDYIVVRISTANVDDANGDFQSIESVSLK